MKLDAGSLGKADNELRTFLRTAESDDPVRVVLILGEGDDTSGKNSAVEVRPSDFNSKADYRNALIDRRKASLRDSVGDTVNSLRQLSLKLTGGEIVRAIVAEGSAGQIAGALKLPGVSSAMLDRTIDLVRPRPSKKDQA